MLVSKKKYRELLYKYQDFGSKIAMQREVIRNLKRELTTARKNLANEEAQRQRDILYRVTTTEDRLSEANHQIALLRDLVSSQGAIINEVFNR